MTVFLRLVAERDRVRSLSESCDAFRKNISDSRIFEATEESFFAIPSAPFAYWVSDQIRESFGQFSRFQSDGRRVERGLFTGNDFRFLRLYWEIPSTLIESNTWGNLSKGGLFSPFYADIHLCVRSDVDFRQIHESIIQKYTYLNGNSDWVLHPECRYGRPGLSYPLRTTKDFAARALPAGCYWTNKGISIFESEGPDVAQDEALFVLGLVNSRAFREFLSLRMGATHAAARSYEEGIVASMPWPTEVGDEARNTLAAYALQIWGRQKTLDAASETSHQFLLPPALLGRLIAYDPPAIEAERARIQGEIDNIAFELYRFSDTDRAAATGAFDQVGAKKVSEDEPADDNIGSKYSPTAIHQIDDLLSWALGVSIGRFDWRLATSERGIPPDLGPFDPLPARSPGMLPDDLTPFHTHSGILVDDKGHPHDLARLIEAVLARVDVPVPLNVRRWLRRNFFSYHLKQYSKSRRKAPVYWPLSTSTGSYTLWLYYPSLTSQTIYSAVNDFIELKLKQVTQDAIALRDKGGARSREDERRFEALQTLELELIELRESLLQVAPTYRPNQDDGVQITAAPLWRLFRHKPWQRVLKDTWAKLEKGDYDWAHLAMTYWPGRVRVKCQTDKSLAIAHNLEHLYVEPELKPAKVSGRRKGG